MKRRDVLRRIGVVMVGITLVGIGAAGCAHSRTYELQAATPKGEVNAVSLRYTQGSVVISQEEKEEFEGALEKELAKEPLVRVTGSGAPLEVRYRFVFNDPGNAGSRVGAAAVGAFGVPAQGFGDGAVALEVTYVDTRSGAVVGKIVTDGPIAGVLGSSEEGLKTAAKSVSEYTKAHYAAMVAK